MCLKQISRTRWQSGRAKRTGKASQNTDPVEQAYDAMFGLETPTADSNDVARVIYGAEIVMLDIAQLVFYEGDPFKLYPQDKLRDLARSIADIGLQQPIRVRPKDGKYEILAGRHRTLAAKMNGGAQIAAIVEDADDETAALIVTDTNLKQREKRLPGMLSMMVFRKVTGSIGGAVTASSGKAGHGGSTASASAAGAPGARPGASVPKPKPMGAKPTGSGAPSAAVPAPATGSGSLSPVATPPPVSPTVKTSDTARSSDKHTASAGHGSAGSAGSPHRPPIGKVPKTSPLPSVGASDARDADSTPSGNTATPHTRASAASPGARTTAAQPALKNPASKTASSKSPMAKPGTVSHETNRHSDSSSTERKAAGGLGNKDISRRTNAQGGQTAPSTSQTNPQCAGNAAASTPTTMPTHMQSAPIPTRGGGNKTINAATSTPHVKQMPDKAPSSRVDLSKSSSTADKGTAGGASAATTTSSSANTSASIHTASTARTQVQQGSTTNRPKTDAPQTVHKSTATSSVLATSGQSAGTTARPTGNASGSVSPGANAGVTTDAAKSTPAKHPFMPTTLADYASIANQTPSTTARPDSARKAPMNTTGAPLNTRNNSTHNNSTYNTGASRSNISGDKQSTKHKPRTLNRTNNQNKPQRRFNHDRNRTQRGNRRP